jgi:hypothetical protein
MGEFKEFLVFEQIGLGQLGPKIDALFNDRDFGNQIHGAITSSDWTGSEQSPTLGYGGHPLHLPSTDLTIPSVQRTGRITHLMLKKNPIYIRLSDGTECQFSYDEYRRIKGIPELGKTMTVVFQRHPEDFTQQHSKIDHAVVRD